ncbi:MAG: SGNH/GDSL hydrolase family protein [Proteobacteria bacterium]|nr:SGNH/GDSL hydrolase family protein [Pseudomonadota bacterium]
MKKWGARLALAGGSILLAALLLEGALRLVAPQQVLRIHPNVWVPLEGGLGHGLAPNLDTVMNTGERDVRFRTDERGHRIGHAGAGTPPPDLRILALGDSFLEAMAVPYPDTMTARLERALADTLSVRVQLVNTGVSGSSPNRYRLVAQRELARQPHAAVVVFLFLGNDVVKRRVESQPPRAPTPRHPLRWPESLAFREWLDAIVHPLYTHLREQSHLVVLLKRRWLGAAIRFGLTDHEFPEVFLRAEAKADRWKVTAGLCEEIAREAGRRGVPALFVLLPPDYVVDRALGRAFARGSGLSADDVDLDQAARILSTRLEAAELRVIDATEGLRAAGPHLYGSVDRHLGPRGHEVVARIVAPALIALVEGGAGPGPSK